MIKVSPKDVKELRISRGWTQSQAAKKWGVSLSTVQKWETPIKKISSRRIGPLAWKAIQSIK